GSMAQSSFFRRLATFLGQPVRLPGWALFLIGAYNFVPDQAARLEFWGRYVPPAVAPYLASPWAGVVLFVLGATWLWFFRGVVHVHHGELHAETSPEASLSAVVQRAEPKARPRDDFELNSALWWVTFSAWGRWQAAQRGLGPDTPPDTSRIMISAWALQDAAERGKLEIWCGRRGTATYELLSRDLLTRLAVIRPEPDPTAIWRMTLFPKAGISDAEKAQIPDCTSFRASAQQIHELWPKNDPMIDAMSEALLA